MVPKKERSNLKNLELINTIKKFKINTSNSTPEVYNMTPESDSINNIKVQNKFDKTYMKGSGEIKTYNEGQPNIIGSSGAFGFIGGGGLKILSKLWKTFSSTPNQYLRAMTKPKPPVIKPKTKISKPKRKEIKYQKQYHENEILEQPSGYYSSDPSRPGWPLPLRNRLAEKAARKIKGTKGL